MILSIFNVIGFLVFIFGIDALVLSEHDLVLGRILLELGVEPVFDGVVGPSRESLCDFAPAVAVLLMHGKDQSVFLLRPLLLPDVGIQMIVPPLSALLANAPRESCSDGTPVLSIVLFDHLPQNIILLPSPRSLGDKGVILELEPAIKALDF